ncbi:MAG: NAD-dependent epimerase/dehydratase family protein [Bacteroidota bacterium]|nr:NAD-dependent epimerase/dehydratase family protein [Bacteroidota bacterium]
MQTIIGAGGAVGTELAKSLLSYTSDIRLVSRNPKKVNPSDQLFPADVTNREQIFKAVEGSEIVYVTVGFDYNIKVWRSTWPPLMRNVIDACKQFKAKLVFFDNIYLYDPKSVGHLTENNPINPSSNKGKVRAEIANMLTDEIKAGNITALIARAPDFYGPFNTKSVLVETVYKPFSTGKPANWFGSIDKIHTFIYTPDAGKATAILGNTPDAYNQVWHLPCDNRKLTGKQFIEMFAKEMNKPVKIQVLPKWMCSIIGLFVPIMKEFPEMYYQYENDYYFDCSKFQEKFNFKVMPYEEGVKMTVQNQ